MAVVGSTLTSKREMASAKLALVKSVVYDLNLEVEWVHYTSTKFSRKVLHFRDKHPSPAERRQARAFRAQCEHARKMFKKTLTAIPED